MTPVLLSHYLNFEEGFLILLLPLAIQGPLIQSGTINNVARYHKSMKEHRVSQIY